MDGLPLNDRRPHREGLETGALHEAGHALVGHLLGWQIKWVRLYDPRQALRSGFDGGAMMTPPRRSLLLHRVAVRLAGESAETLRSGRDVEQIAEDGADDREQLWAVDLAQCHLARERKQEIIEQGDALSRRLLAWNWTAFLHLADAVTRGGVSGAAARRIIRRAAVSAA
jgi:hypothetical protein